MSSTSIDGSLVGIGCVCLCMHMHFVGRSRLTGRPLDALEKQTETVLLQISCQQRWRTYGMHAATARISESAKGFAIPSLGELTYFKLKDKDHRSG